MPAIQHILVPTDFSESAEAAVRYAVELAKQVGARVTLLHVVEIPIYTYSTSAYLSADFSKTIEEAAQARLEQALAELRKALPEAQSMLVSGPPGDAIRNAVASEGADLVVMGTHGRRGLAHAMLGSVAEKTVRVSNVPVLVVHGSKA